MWGQIPLNDMKLVVKIIQQQPTGLLWTSHYSASHIKQGKLFKIFVEADRSKKNQPLRSLTGLKNLYRSGTWGSRVDDCPTPPVGAFNLTLTNPIVSCWIYISPDIQNVTQPQPQKSRHTSTIGWVAWSPLVPWLKASELEEMERGRISKRKADGSYGFKILGRY